ncbi:MAG: hypothetical protein D6748_10675 [Calditrichaeota bacterium]|nr:MAG: hypothetical protein D6748_10675 [Calditrichota bacterium]
MKFNSTLPPTPSLAKRGGEGGEFNKFETNSFLFNYSWLNLLFRQPQQGEFLFHHSPFTIHNFPFTILNLF